MTDMPSLLIGPVRHEWKQCLHDTTPAGWRVVELTSRRMYVRDAHRYSAAAAVMGAMDHEGVPNGPLIAAHLVRAGHCPLVCVHDSPVIALPSPWCTNTERILHILLGGRSYGDACAHIWQLLMNTQSSPHM
ncbi:MAG: hypothetical protein JWM95_79 [Gemmatimonadetes bacterium]|nr:hypothetical protein [Gemmatimonadota bacterium]